MIMKSDLLPGILIPCENLEALKELILELYEKGILTNETFALKNVPENFNDILNDPTYFESVDICGFKTIKGKTKHLECKTETLL